ncbi:MAG: hypothetical protein HDQ99_02435 [Lachnospiraceae bacterium]|nr:hypothetical protein [Lachnospiraceae bacterium]
MLNFNNIEDLVTHMFENLDNEDNLVSVVANKDITVEIMKELLAYDNVILDLCNVNSFEYDREYLLSLHDETDTDHWHVSVEQIYNYDKEMYLGTSGYVLFHEDVNSKAMLDMQNNEFMPLGEHDWFIFWETAAEDDYEDDNTEDTDPDVETDDKDVDSGYSVTVKVDLDTDEVGKIIRDMKKNMQRELSGVFDMLYRPYPYEYHPSPLRFFL